MTDADLFCQGDKAASLILKQGKVHVAIIVTHYAGVAETILRQGTPEHQQCSHDFH